MFGVGVGVAGQEPGSLAGSDEANWDLEKLQVVFT